MGLNDTAQPNADTQPEQQPTTVQPGNQDAGGGMTQAQIDAIVQSRLAEERRRLQTKYGDLDELAKAKQELDAKREAEMSELEKLQQALAAKDAEIATAQKEANDARLHALRLRVGRETGLSVLQSARLQGADEESLRADAEAVKADLGQGDQQTVTIPDVNASAGGEQRANRSTVKLTPTQQKAADFAIKRGVFKDYAEYAASLRDMQGD